MKNAFLKIKFCIFALLIGLTQQTTAQDGVVLRDLEINQALINASQKPLPRMRKSERPPLQLPFFEDFSSLRSPYPNDSLWEDNMVFINASFPLLPPTIGVATFDALGADGRLYEHAAAYPFGADTLTSRAIRLDSIFGETPRDLEEALTEGDTVFFSFYYQPGGGFGANSDGTALGRAPKRDDQLILEFRNDTAGWNQVWYANGQTLAQFCPLCVIDSILVTPEIITETDTIPAVFRRVEDVEKEFFRQVAIPVSANFLHDKFQFRFRTISSLDQIQNPPPGDQSSGGQWHIDYIRLDIYPDGFSEFSPDIAFVEQSRRVFRDFQAMPWKQFQGSSDLESEIQIVFRNLGSIAQTAGYQQQILNQDGQIVHSTTPSFANIFPFFSHGFNSDPPHSQQPLLYHFPDINSPETFTILHTLKRSGEDQDHGVDNDTMIQTVHFGDYFAYDDGTPEQGFGFRRETDRLFSQFAYRFPLRVSDSLIGIQIWFNHTLMNMNRAFFNLAVWTPQNDGTPSQTPIYAGPDILPEYHDTIGFVTYWLDSAIGLPPGEFFIGIQQHGNAYLNIGFDKNNNAEHRMLISLFGSTWDTVFFYGSVMMRPLFGTSASIPTSISEKKDGVDVFETIRVFPNPSDGVIFVESPENVVNICEIYDLNGRRVLQKTIRDTRFSINLPEKPGIYILVLHTENGVVSQKIIRQ